MAEWELLEKVRCIDEEAARILESDTAKTFYNFRRATTINDSFIWNSTPQGWDYWNKIDRKVNLFSSNVNSLLNDVDPDDRDYYGDGDDDYEDDD